MELNEIVQYSMPLFMAFSLIVNFHSNSVQTVEIRLTRRIAKLLQSSFTNVIRAIGYYYRLIIYRLIIYRQMVNSQGNCRMTIVFSKIKKNCV